MPKKTLPHLRTPRKQSASQKAAGDLQAADDAADELAGTSAPASAKLRRRAGQVRTIATTKRNPGDDFQTG